MTGTPLPHCPFTVEQAYNGQGGSHDCVNRRFFDDPRKAPRACAPSTSAEPHARAAGAGGVRPRGDG